MYKKFIEKLREREREPFFCERKPCIEWNRYLQIYSKRMWIRRDKIKEDEEKEEENIYVEGSGEMKRRRIIFM